MIDYGNNLPETALLLIFNGPWKALIRQIICFTQYRAKDVYCTGDLSPQPVQLLRNVYFNAACKLSRT